MRYIGNHSTGAMGFALAHEFASRSAEVTLISGPSKLNTHNKNILLIRVTSASEMYQTTTKEFQNADIVIMSAAVADYTPTFVSKKKIKKKSGDLQLTLKRTKDIIKELGRKKSEKQILIGFALETNDAIKNAKTKLHTKNLDFIVLNSLEDAGAGFGLKTNKVSIINKNNEIVNFALKTKLEVACDIADYTLQLTNSN